jgi:(E)-4-hydroxy-3-methylbut-2-enyl-diphosphate synthase
MTVHRRKTRKLRVGSVEVGGNSPITVQSMTKTDTKDVAKTLRQIRRLANAGCEIVRVALPTLNSVKALEKIVAASPIPVEADTHFSTAIALAAVKAGAHSVRINPGNMRNRRRLKEVATSAKERGIPIRVGLNSGSIGRFCGDLSRALARAALDCAELLESAGLRDIMISVKGSDVTETARAYRIVASSCDYPLHLGVTATGVGDAAVIKSSIGIGSLLLDGIGDTIRVSLTGDPVREVEVGREILRSLRLRSFGPEIISCPTCGRCEVDLVKMVTWVERELRDLPQPAAGGLKVAVMGCVVNGPGEAREADIGVAFGRGVAYIFKGGRKLRKVSPDAAVSELLKEIPRPRGPYPREPLLFIRGKE